MGLLVFFIKNPLRSNKSSLPYIFDVDTILFKYSASVLTQTSPNRASSLGMMSEEEKKLQRIEDIKELLS